jgi:hypothetical protein
LICRCVMGHCYHGRVPTTHMYTYRSSRIMKKYEPSKRIIEEIPITTVSKYHEGRIDAILEYSGNQYVYSIEHLPHQISPIANY